MKVIEFHTKLPNTKQGAFVIFYTLDSQPWKKYVSNHRLKKLTIPTCLMLHRFSGDIGFVGGIVDRNETLKQAAIREVKEEIGYKITDPLEPLVAHHIKELKLTTHAFCLELPESDLRDLQMQAIQAPHFGSEITGVFLPHLFDYKTEFGKGGGIADLLKNHLAPSVREELVYFLLKKDIYDKPTLDKICRTAGYELKDLLK